MPATRRSSSTCPTSRSRPSTASDWTHGQPATDGAADAAESLQRVLGRAASVSGLLMAGHRRRMPAAARRQVDHRRRSGFGRNIRPGDRDTGARVLELRGSRARASARAAGHVDIAADQPPAARRRLRHQLQPLRRAGDAGQPHASHSEDSGTVRGARRPMPFPARARTACQNLLVCLAGLGEQSRVHARRGAARRRTSPAPTA